MISDSPRSDSPRSDRDAAPPQDCAGDGSVGLNGVSPSASASRGDRYAGPPPIVLVGEDGVPRMAPFLLSREDLVDFFRLRESRTRFPSKTIQRYRALGLRSVRIGRKVWFRLDDVLRFLDQQQDRLDSVR